MSEQEPKEPSEYELLRDAVLSAQEKRVSDGQVHTNVCECDNCLVERAYRRKLEETADHILEQKNWVYLMLELLGRI